MNEDRFGELLTQRVILIDQELHKFIDENFEDNYEKLKFLHLVYLNLLGNSVQEKTKDIKFLASNFAHMKKMVSEIFDDILEMKINYREKH